MPGRRPIGFAHRGGRGGAPGNTLPAFRAALEAGAGGLESDVWLTADGVPVLHHDARIRLGWLSRRSVRRLCRDELPESVPSLADLYATCGTAYELSLDILDPAAVPAVLGIAREYGATGRLWLCGERSVSQWRTLDPAVGLVVGIPRVNMPGGLPARLRTLREEGVTAVNLPYPRWSARRVAAVHAAGLLAFGWDAHDAGRVGRLLAMGCDGVYSDSVAALVAAG